VIAAFAAAAVIGTAQAARIDSIVRTVMHDSAIRGLSLGIARGDSVLYLRGYGSRDARHGADGFTIYAIGSVTKQFTAALVLQNAQAGRLSLDAGSPTVRSLMQQISGDSWQYDNANYAALGALLERTESAPYCVLLAQRILRPQNLFSTACGAPPASENVATSEARYEAPIAPAAGGLWSNAFDLVRWLGALRAGRFARVV
jgi:CubicO group peptidase (beta-lactamase class C family)